MTKIVRKYFDIKIENPKLDATGLEGGFFEPYRLTDFYDFMPSDPTKKTEYYNKALGYSRWFNLVLAITKASLFFLGSVKLTYSDAGKTYIYMGIKNSEKDLPEESVANEMYFVKDVGKYKVSDGSVFSDIDIKPSVLTPTKLEFRVGYELFDNFYEYDFNGELHEKLDGLKTAIEKVLSSSFKSIDGVYNPELDTLGRNPSGMPIGWQTQEIIAKRCDDNKGLDIVTIAEVVGE